MARRPEFYYDPKTGYYRKRLKLHDGTWKDVRAKTKEELRAKLYELETAQRMGVILNDATTVVELAVQWYTNRKDKWSYSRQQDYANAINVHICPVIGAMRVRDVKPEDCQRILANMSHLSNSMQSKTVITLKQLFDCAEENGLIFRSPCAKLKAGGAKAKEKVPLTPEQCQTLLEATKGTRAYLFVMLALYAGLRREEICGLRWCDVDLDATPPRLTVNHAVRFEGTKAVFPSPLKTPSAHRTIPLPSQLAAALVEAKGSSSSEFVTPADRGGHATPQTVKNIIKIIDRRRVKPGDDADAPAVNKHGPKVERTLDFPVRLHVLRHTYVTRLFEAGMNLKEVQYLAGHSDLNVTLSIYTHLTQNQPEQLIHGVESAFGPVSSTLSSDP